LQKISKAGAIARLGGATAVGAGMGSLMMLPVTQPIPKAIGIGSMGAILGGAALFDMSKSKYSPIGKPFHGKLWKKNKSLPDNHPLGKFLGVSMKHIDDKE
jgi:hypothetical protein